jgi:hypothetical protein
MTTTARTIPLALCTAFLTVTLTAIAQQGMPKTTKESIAGAAAVKTEQLHGTVVSVEGNHLAVKMSTGEVRGFDVPESRRFLIDGQEMTVGQLKPGTKLTATITTTTTPVTERTTTVGSGKVWYVSGNTVIVTLPNNENKQYKVAESYRFNVNGQKASVHDLRKGMIISAEKIVEEPKTEIASNTTVTGQAPPPPPPVQARTEPPPVMAQARPRPRSTPAPVAAPEPVASPVPAELPKTASEVPLIGLLGLLSIGASFLVRMLRQA